jgi:hypothetical protein
VFGLKPLIVQFGTSLTLAGVYREKTMALESDESSTQKEIKERFQRLFSRPMTAEERACLFLPPESEDDFKARCLATLTREE